MHTHFIGRRLTACLLLVAVLSALVVIPASAAITPYDYNMSSDYKNSVFYKNLTSLTLTGNGATDLLMVAISQLGYHEGDSDADFAGMNASGGRNFVEYNRLYGKVDNQEGNGVSYGYAWCASFVNWCLRQAGIAKTVAGGEISCSRWINNFLKPNNIWQDAKSWGGTYMPKSGDLIFFRTVGSSSLSTHIGIVRYADDKNVYTIEGNAGGRVGFFTYTHDDVYVIGYGTPKYSTDGYATYDYSNKTQPGVFIVTADTLNVRPEASTTNEPIAKLAKADTVTVYAFEGSFARILLDDGREGYVSTSYIEFVSGIPLATYTVKYEIGEAGGRFYGQTKTEGFDLVLIDKEPWIKGMTFLGWSDAEGGEVLYQPGDTYTVDADVTLYAIFVPTAYKITFVDADGNVVAEIECLENAVPEISEIADVEKDGLLYQVVGTDKPLAPATEDAVYVLTFLVKDIEDTTAEEETTANGEQPIASGCTSSVAVTSLSCLSLLALPALILRKKED